MEQIRVYITSPGKHNEGELVGVWFTPPVDFDGVKKRIRLNGEYEEYAIRDYELPLEIGEYTPVEETNRLYGLAEELKGMLIGKVVSEIQHAFSNPFEEMVEYADDITYYLGCNDMSDVVYYLIVEAGDLGEVSEHLKTYIDLDACGRDLEIDGNCLVTSRGVFELMQVIYWN